VGRSTRRPILTSSESGRAAWPRAPTSSGGVFDVEGQRRRVEELARETGRPDLWEDRERAEQLLREKRRIEREVALFDTVAGQLEDAEVLLELAEEADDAAARAEVADKLSAVERDLEQVELRRLLGGEHDVSNAIVSINAGEGGTDACDWAEMLLRMYSRWAENHGHRVELLDVQPGDEAGIRSVTFSVSGDFAYGQLKTENGVHRLVRISPFDAQARRHTAFAVVSVLPEIDDTIVVEINENDLRIDTYRAGGAGGQHVNKTDSAVRMTHLPTGIVVQCQNERSQHKNRASAMKVLRARLYEYERRKRDEEMRAMRGQKARVGFGSEGKVRSYTLHPQQRIKDHRTDLEVGNVDAVLHGDIDRFIRAALVAGAAEAEA
jgi:peptide chain release factor 2